MRGATDWTSAGLIEKPLPEELPATLRLPGSVVKEMGRTSIRASDPRRSK